MAAYRQYVPVRDTESAFRVEDRTMCRMPSPRPGPLRCESEREPLDFLRKEERGNLTSSASPVVTGVFAVNRLLLSVREQ